MELTSQELCQGMPEEFVKFLEYVRNNYQGIGKMKYDKKQTKDMEQYKYRDYSEEDESDEEDIYFHISASSGESSDIRERERYLLEIEKEKTKSKKKLNKYDKDNYQEKGSKIRKDTYKDSNNRGIEIKQQSQSKQQPKQSNRNVLATEQKGKLKISENQLKQQKQLTDVKQEDEQKSLYTTFDMGSLDTLSPGGGKVSGAKTRQEKL
ncbi:MAG: hypothetical protein EZS28_031693, partial [Streblomastix strix]